MNGRTEVHRAPQKQNFDPEIVQAILLRAIVAHVAITIDGQPFALPVACAPYRQELLLHGSTASRLFKALVEGVPACVTITHIDALVLARSSFESSMHYQSLMALGQARTMAENEKRQALQALTDHLFPQRRKELRKSTENEIKATSIVAFPLTEISVKVSDGQPNDSEVDIASEVWAGILPLKLTYGIPIAADNLRPEILIPDYISVWPQR
jgi:nitroimidazol reductase NimA-like FMN-containing flavoprotein (pyridoxamine 5'-phosphate oxidase superfamily)